MPTVASPFTSKSRLSGHDLRLRGVFAADAQRQARQDQVTVVAGQFRARSAVGAAAVWARGLISVSEFSNRAA